MEAFGLSQPTLEQGATIANSETLLLEQENLTKLSLSLCIGLKPIEGNRFTVRQK
jgi:hypothetical protein